MPPIGETLREARMRRRVDIADVEQATKIRAKYLRALEAEEFDRLPGSTFVRTFLRTYAEYLGLDSQLLVDEYRSRHESPADEEAPFAPQPSSRPVAREGRRRAQPTGPRPGRGPLIAGAVVTILGILLVIGLIAGGDDGDESAGRPVATAPGDEPGRDKRRGGDGDGERRQPNRVTLEVTPLADTYVCVENDQGEELVNATLVEPQTFRGETLRVNLGNTLSLEMTANGEEVELEESPNPVGLEFTPEGQEEIPEGERPCQ